MQRGMIVGTSIGAVLKSTGPPERILIYHGGTGRTLFLGVLRITTIFLFGVSCLVVAPAFMSSEFPSYLGPASKDACACVWILLTNSS